MLSFSFANKDSYKDYGIFIAKRPIIPSPKRRVSYVPIPGRDSSIKFDEETYEDITVLVECTLKSRENLTDKIDEIKGWLFSSGESNLIFSYQANKRYIAQVVNAIDFKPIYKSVGAFPLVFNCKPFKYEVSNQVITIVKTDSIINNMGTLESSPIITVYGSGNIELFINDTLIKLKGINNSIIINSDIEDCYNEALDNLNFKMEGNFPKLKIGENKISWVGSVSKIVLLPNWRWL
ncbi:MULTISPECIES: distal tail protein Dit [Clostridium]|uniref:Phage putative tail component n=2 Tax=Clostridium TaxID=1485 RepID=A0A381J9K4_9CLOT|nr:MULTISPECIES: distal tail protein Dit [Clostridium]MBB6630683.1 phage tail family protein [Clostridium algidicarnis]PPK44958.1 putative phage tail component-like protein [Clostridium algidicarnis DSM 15099]SUY47693.1 phage putative tail component [Clostridium putrefaciens]